MLSTRTQAILKIIIGEYISRAAPVPSDFIAHQSGLGLSPATVRNEMAHLEEEGLITRRHISSGGVPSDRGYRYYVDTLEETRGVSASEQRLIQHLFHQVEKRLEEWSQLTASILARLTQNAALITPPRAIQSRLWHLDLVRIQEFLALLILVLQETKMKRQLLAFDQAVSQEELSQMAQQINTAFAGLNSPQIARAARKLPAGEQQVTQAVLQIMKEEDEARYVEPYLQGIRDMLNQPEFAQSQKMLDVIDLLEGGELLRNALAQAAPGEGVQVIIGEENKEESLHGLSLIITHYGVPGVAGGIIGIIGPTRMHYGRNISQVRYLSSVMSHLLSQLHGETSPESRVPPHRN